MTDLAASLSLRLPSPIVEIEDRRLDRRGVRLHLKRDDLIHPDLPGNKWRKLKHNLAAAATASASASASATAHSEVRPALLTFGGAYSNHIRATAAAGSLFGFETIGVIRGEEHLPLNDSLAYAVSKGMRLTYLDRTTYRRKSDPEVISCLRRRFGDFYLVPEGGANAAGVLGCAELVDEIDIPYDIVCCPCGTGTTLAGIAAGLDGLSRAVKPQAAQSGSAGGPAGRSSAGSSAGSERRPRALGFSVLKGGPFLDSEVSRLQSEAYGAISDNWRIEYGYHFGGFAKRTAELDAFANDFSRQHAVILDRVYVAKMMYGIFALADQGAFPEGCSIVAVITG